MGLILHPIASSSEANTTVIDTGSGLVCVDAGVQRLDTLSRFDAPIRTLLITHEHHDHSHYAAQWRKARAEILSTFSDTIIKPWDVVELKEGAIATAMPIPHDAKAETVAWRVYGPKGTAVVATDLGEIPHGFTRFVEGATDVLLEASYHPRLLAACGYIEPLKQRIEGPRGHLSALDAIAWIKDGLPDSVERLWLGHLSKVACCPNWLRAAAGEAIGGRKIELTVLEK